MYFPSSHVDYKILLSCCSRQELIDSIVIFWYNLCFLPWTDFLLDPQGNHYEHSTYFIIYNHSIRLKSCVFTY